MDFIKKPSGIYLNSQNHLYCCDYEKNRIICFDLNNGNYSNNNNNKFEYLFEFGNKGNQNGQIYEYNPQFISIDKFDNLFINDDWK